MANRRLVLMALAVVLAAGPVRADPELAGLTQGPSAQGLGTAPADAAFPAVTGMKVARNGADTRIVLDIDGQPRFSHRTTTTGRSVLISFPAVDWQVPSESAESVGVVSKILFGRGTGGSGDMAIIAAEPVKVSRAQAVPPAGGSGHWRMVLDLMPLSALLPGETHMPGGFGTVTVELAE